MPSKRRELQQLMLRLRSRVQSPEALRPDLPQPIRNPRAGRTFDDTLAEYLQAMAAFPADVLTQAEAVFLAEQALLMVDRASPTSASNMYEMQFLWDAYITTSSGVGRPDLAVPHGGISPGAAIQMLAIAFWRPELAEVWAASPEREAASPQPHEPRVTTKPGRIDIYLPGTDRSHWDHVTGAIREASDADLQLAITFGTPPSPEVWGAACAYLLVTAVATDALRSVIVLGLDDEGQGLLRQVAARFNLGVTAEQSSFAVVLTKADT